MSDAAISVRALSKAYRLYRRSPYRLLDFLGLRIGSADRHFKEFTALEDVSFDIARGSTVGIIGRNGAGKSTLLKLLSGVSPPTRGEVVLNGPVSCLLELGTGFHPDLTGHENIYVSGLYLGLDRTTMDALYDDIVAFAELGEFIHQPVRTYSTGMYMRLAFSVATCVPAEIRIIDEVLGVGDAYFFGKCLRRIREWGRQGCTTVLVSHDNGAVLRLCSRCLWIEQGRVKADGPPLEVVTAYLHSVYENHDRNMAMGGQACSEAQHVSYSLRAGKSIRIDEVTCLGESGQAMSEFPMGTPMIMRVAYRSDVDLSDAVVSVVVYREDGVTVLNAISSVDGVFVDLRRGQGAVDLLFDRLLLGPGDYSVAVGIYPSLDLSDSSAVQHAVIWAKTAVFRVLRDVSIAVDLGVVRHPVRWKVRAFK